jgi:hypothetical protein
MRSPSVAQVLARLPAGRRNNSGNMLSLDYDLGPNGQPRLKDELKQQWSCIFGTSTSSGYGRNIRGNLAEGARSSWGNSKVINKKNFSERIVNGRETAICLGIRSSGAIRPASLGHHAG